MAVLLGIDFETTGLDPEKDRVIEAAYAVYETVSKRILYSSSFLVEHIDIEIPPEITKITGITSNMMHTFGLPRQAVLGALEPVFPACDYVVAHNASFEKGFLWQYLNPDQHLWIDTMTDLPEYQGKSLSHIIGELGIVNPAPHRAYGDVLAMLQVLSRFDFTEVERRATAPKITLVADVSYDDREHAKALGYQWINKSWRKTVPDFLAAEEQEKAEATGKFKVFILQTAGETALV